MPNRLKATGHLNWLKNIRTNIELKNSKYTMRNIQKMIGATLLVVVLAVSSIQTAWTQNIDNERMNRDIKITEKVLATLFKSGSEDYDNHFSVGGTGAIRGTYIPNYGVLFRIPQMFFNNINNEVVYLGDQGNKQLLHNRVKVINIDNYNSGDIVYWLDDRVISTKQIKIGSRIRTQKLVKGVSIDSVLNGRRDKALKLIKVFLRDYSSLLSQLSDNDKIVVTYDKVLNMNHLFRKKPNLKDRNSLMVSVAYKDVKANTGKSLENKIQVSSLQIPPENKLQLEVLQKILDELYQRKNTDGKSFYRSGRSSYTQLKDFGVIYDLRLRAPRKHNRPGAISYTTNGGSGGSIIISDNDHDNDNKNQTPEQRRKKREEAKIAYQKLTGKAYAKLEKDLKKQLADYGRTLRNIAPNERLMLNVRLSSRHSECFDENGKEMKLPRVLVLTAKMSDLNSNNAESKINLKKIYK